MITTRNEVMDIISGVTFSVSPEYVVCLPLPDAKEMKTEGGLFIPKSETMMVGGAIRCAVIAVGEKAKSYLKPGQLVFCRPSVEMSFIEPNSKLTMFAYNKDFIIVSYDKW